MKTAAIYNNEDSDGVTPNNEVRHYTPKINLFRILVAYDDSSILELFRQGFSCLNTGPLVLPGIQGSKGNPSYQNTPKLPSQSFDIVTCRQADEAVDAAKKAIREGRPFSVVFIDSCMLPGADGIWAAERIRKLDSDIEIVMVTGHMDIHPGVIACWVPPAHKLLYIRKPFQPREIFQLVSVLSVKWHTECELKKVNKELEARLDKKNQHLKKGNEKLDGIIKSVTDHMCMIDEAYNIVWENAMGQKLFGKNMVGKKCYNVYYGRKKPCRHCMVRNTFADGIVYEQEKELFGKNGNKIIFWCTSNVAERCEDGYPKRVVTIFRDITELKQVEKELRNANHKLLLTLEKRSKTLSDTLKKMEQKEKDLTQHKSDLEKLNKEMLETNRALSVLARNIDKNKELFEKKIYETTTVKILPIIKDLKNNKSCQRVMADLDVLEANLNSLFSGLNNHHEIISFLTDQEMRVAALIKRGLTNEKISNLLYISEHTVKTHRKNIRKKLKIKNTNINLSSYLKSNLPSDLTCESHAQAYVPTL